MLSSAEEGLELEREREMRAMCGVLFQDLGWS